ncbi:MAG TPA: zinc-binding dehydrogenase, partial [Coleofasciculaceae cyanobacterium]
VDAVFDGIGGKHLLRSYRTLRQGGRLINYGFSSALSAKRGRFFRLVGGFLLVPLLDVLPDGKLSVFYSISADKKSHPDWFQEDLKTLLDLLKNQKIKPAIAQRIPLVEAAHAHELIDKAAVSGKLVLICQ